MLRNSTLHVCANSLKGLLAISCLAAGLQAEVEQVVLVDNQVHLDPQELARAEDRAGRIFRAAGIQVRWVDCGRAEEKCAELMGPRYIRLNIVRDPTDWFCREALGYAAPAPEGGIYAAVFVDRIERLARISEGLAPSADILGHAIAHEIGHLLLSLVGHAPSGIMTARWTRTDLKQMGMCGLRFPSEQAAKMRAEVERRSGSDLAAMR